MMIEDEILAKRDKDSFDAGFSAGIGWAINTDNEPLIAAAPELLEALKALVSLAEAKIADSKNCHEIQHAKSAIAKAEGR
jgi:hypothetical protein